MNELCQANTWEGCYSCDRTMKDKLIVCPIVLQLETKRHFLLWKRYRVYVLDYEKREQHFYSKWYKTKEEAFEEGKNRLEEHRRIISKYTWRREDESRTY